jgi:hypothetical protein
MDFMQIMQGVDLNTILIAGGVLVTLFLVVSVLGSVLSIFGFIGDIFGNLSNVIFALLGCGPLPGCGCLFAVLSLAGCGIVTVYIVGVVQTCGTPQAVNFCQLLGY